MAVSGPYTIVIDQSPTTINTTYSQDDPILEIQLEITHQISEGVAEAKMFISDSSGQSLPLIAPSKPSRLTICQADSSWNKLEETCSLYNEGDLYLLQAILRGDELWQPNTSKYVVLTWNLPDEFVQSQYQLSLVLGFLIS